VFCQLAGTMARVFTTLTETGDRLLFWGFALATIFNAIIAAQVILYWNGNARKDLSRWDESPTKRGELPLAHTRGGPKRD